MRIVFNNKVHTKKENNPTITGKIVYRNDKLTFISNDGLVIKDLPTEGYICKTLYSLPCNDKHNNWTRKKLEKGLLVTKEIGSFWSGFKPANKIKFKIDNNDIKFY